MPCRVAFEGDLVYLHVFLRDTRTETGERGFPEIWEPTQGRWIVVRGTQEEITDALEEQLRPQEEELNAQARQWRRELEDELTDEARRLLPSEDVTEDVTVTLSWKPGSLEVAALIACGKIVADIGAFLSGLREIRTLFPQRIRERISGWVGPHVAIDEIRLETKTGLLRGKAEEPSKPEEPTKPSTEEDSDTRPFSLGALAAYAALSLTVLVVVVLLVVGGVALLIAGGVAY
jgi:hypothetical protein